MFTKIGEYLKPLLGRRDHIPLDAVSPVDPNEHRGGGKGRFKKTSKKDEFEDTKDTMSLSLVAIQAMLEKEMIEDIDLYTKVQFFVSGLNKKKITHIPVLQNEKLFHALEKAAFKYNIEKL